MYAVSATGIVHLRFSVKQLFYLMIPLLNFLIQTLNNNLLGGETVFMLRSSSLAWWLCLSGWCDWWCPSSEVLPWSLKEDFSDDLSGGGASLSMRRGEDELLKLLTLLWLTSSAMSSSSSSSPHRFRGDQVILFSFLSLLLAFANHVDTCYFFIRKK